MIVLIRTCGVAAVSLWLCGCADIADKGYSAEGTRVEVVQKLISDSARPPQRDAAWQTIELSDAWEHVGDSVWYRFEAPDLPRDQGLLAIHLGRVIMNASLWVDGEEVANGGSMTPPIAQNWNRPLLFTFPPRLLRETASVYLNVRRPEQCFGFLGEVRIGTARQLRSTHSLSELRVTAAQASTYIGITLTVLLIALFINAPQAKYGWGVVMCALFVLASLNFHVRDLPMDSRSWETLATLTTVWGLLAAYQFALSFIRKNALVEGRPRIVLGYLVMATFALSFGLIVTPHPYFHWLYNLLIVVALGLAIFVWTLLILDQERHGRWLLGVAAFAVLLLFLPDVGHQLKLLSPQFPSLAPLSGPLMALALVAIVASNQLEQHKLELERSAEQQRLTRELHDGLSGHLVSTLALAENHSDTERIASGLRSALQDLRLVLSAINPVEASLDTILGRLRQQFERPLQTQGIELKWRLEALPEPTDASGEVYLNIARIVQEALTNVLRHSRASSVEVIGRANDGGITLEIVDDGVGLTGHTNGLGLANMAHRARNMNASVSVDDIGTGTRVRLTLR